MKLEMGIYDAPQRQEQPRFYLDLLRNNVAVFGGPMTGKTTFIKTLLYRLNENPDAKPEENTYIIDFGGNIGRFAGLPSVCAYFDNSNEENIKRVFKALDARLSSNAIILGSDNYSSRVDSSSDNCPSHLTLIIENLNAFLSDERYATYQDKLLRLCRDGLSKGLSVVVTINDVVGTNRLMSYFGQKVAFEMPVDSYFEIFNTKVVKPMKIPGRGLINLESNVYEFQAFLPYVEETQLDRLLQRPHRKNDHLLIAFPETLTIENCSQYCPVPLQNNDSGINVLIGLDYYEQLPIHVNLAECRSIGIYGKRQFGKTNLLKLLLAALSKKKRDIRYIMLDDGRKQLSKDHLSEFYRYAEQNHSEVVYLTSVDGFRMYLIEKGYIKTSSGPMGKPVASSQSGNVSIPQLPFTVFVLQNKSLFLSTENPDVSNLIRRLLPDMIANAEARDYLFIFSDVKKISAPDVYGTFNSNLSIVFLLDNIGEFISDKGQKSVFGEMDPKELKAEYAKCSVGDGYYFDVESDVLQKIKIIKA